MTFFLYGSRRKGYSDCSEGPIRCSFAIQISHRYSNTRSETARKSGVVKTGFRGHKTQQAEGHSQPANSTTESKEQEQETGDTRWVSHLGGGGVPGLFGKPPWGLIPGNLFNGWKCLTWSLQYLRDRQCSDKGEVPMADKGSVNIKHIQWDSLISR